MENQMIENLRLVDFGEIDGYGDPNLERYFLDDGYWNKIIENSVFYVVGKKGTGKSSIYRMIEKQGIEEGAIIINKDFGEFPFERLLLLQDNAFAKPNQYQTIWKNVILNLFAQSISNLPPEENNYYKSLRAYVDTYIGAIEDLHKEVITKTDTKNGSLLFKGFGLQRGHEVASTFKINDDNLTSVNKILEDSIINFFKTTSYNGKIILQFDRLDDNYNQYQNIDEYYQAIISLFKVVYAFNQSLRSKQITNVKVLIYIRSDIMRELAHRDAESARWDDFKFELVWSVNNLRDWRTSNLFKMVEKRIQTSHAKLADKSFLDVFVFNKKMLLDCKIRSNNFFIASVLETLFRPRDLIKLCKTLQEEIVKRGYFDNRIYVAAMKKYSNWLVNTELANEINPILGDDYKKVIELLRLCGSNNMSVAQFTERYKSLKDQIKFSPLDLLNFLYSVGIIENTWKAMGHYMHRSIYRNEGDFDRNLTFRILPQVWRGLTV